MELNGEGFVLRPWRPGDEATLVKHANNHKIWRNLTEVFPYPYTQEAADQWIQQCAPGVSTRHDLAIDVNGEAVGSIGSMPHEGVRSHTRSVGYWLGEAFWGRGIASAALALYVEEAFRLFEVHRLQAFVYAWNPGSARVLEKNGFQLEGTRRESIYKDGQYVDELLYGLLRKRSASGVHHPEREIQDAGK